MTPLVSIVVTCFNQASYLERSVKSVLSQTFTDLECIIVDDGSSDNTEEVAKRLMNLDSRVSYFHKPNGGVSSARNYGFPKARGEWIQFLDGDDWIHEDKIRFQLSHVSESRQENTAFYTDYERVFIDREGNITQRQENIVGSLTTEELIQRLLIPDFLADSPFPLLQQCLLMHRSIFQKKMFDEKLKALQDRDFCIDLLVAGVNFIYTPMVGAYYTKHQTNRTNSWSYMKNYYILFYETVCGKHQELIPLSQVGIDFLVKEAIREKEEDNFTRLIKMIKPPLYFLNNKIKIYHTSLLKLIYITRLVIPSFLLYEKYRGPRSKKVIAFLSKLTSRVANGEPVAVEKK
ncbi:glycosyltransferase [Aetokthonos hydrillicola Thurmond2011]|jgi:glycosyltransferase involved in cell wall biosynthesis|uniref:Glycosyltransferase n=1 Tax=Aetokthonos hydrillicola Thurmond2011 TaxID=2712845 RepID=A0AAP5IFA2_9CYAN|nr:glycosyltransferase family 2 protein [Aetokthonos hydrillicola]MBO3461924.1 glycosyltransferase family 2 protein [Aetokthonos hydrillicola CCALA 1050]MBW4585411.1 glycosyltransferase [Aetokthonos hydrillicola CCALA 1050]MDR9899082.1 glycosyltransferase [Aetokthonos hydrillicola Thurmond2011]